MRGRTQKALPPAIRAAVDRASGILGGDCVAFGVLPSTDGWRVDHVVACSAGRSSPKVERAVVTYLRSAPSAFADFDPVHPPAHERNVVRGPRYHARLFAARPPLDIVARLWRPLGWARAHMARVLLCDGQQVLSCLVVHQRAPFRRGSLARLSQSVQELAWRAAMDRATQEAPSDVARLSVALEALGAPAFLVGADAEVELMNAAATAAVERDGAAIVSRIRAAVAARESAPALDLWPLCPRAGRSHWLVVLRARTGIDARLDAAARRWDLTPREREVLDLVVRGLANKEIAEALRCSPRTVEVHLGTVFKKAGKTARAELIASVWDEAGR